MDDPTGQQLEKIINLVRDACSYEPDNRWAWVSLNHVGLKPDQYGDLKRKIRKILCFA